MLLVPSFVVGKMSVDFGWVADRHVGINHNLLTVALLNVKKFLFDREKDL
jgi:hypothetical protein